MHGWRLRGAAVLWQKRKTGDMGGVRQEGKRTVLSDDLCLNGETDGKFTDLITDQRASTRDDSTFGRVQRHAFVFGGTRP